MLTKTIDSRGFLFEVWHNEQSLEFKAWQSTNDCIYYLPLANLVDNGNASVVGKICVVPFENIYLLDPQERSILGIPKLYDKAVRLRGEGTLNLADFCYNLELLTHVPDGELIPFERMGNVVTCGKVQYLLNEEQYILFSEVEHFNTLDDACKTTEFNFIQFAKIKQQAEKASCFLDSYLDNESVCAPSKVRLGIGEDENGVFIKPEIDIEDKERFTTAFEKSKRIPNFYSLQDKEGRRVRVVLSEEQKRGLEPIKVRKCRFGNHEEFLSVMESPTEYFDPEHFDISEFYSERVVEIGLYKPKFSAFVSPYKSQWIVGAEVEIPSLGTSRIEIHDEAALKDLQQQIEIAEQQHHSLVDYCDTKLDIDDARFLAETASKQLECPNECIQNDNKKERKVLIIKDNGESLDYAAQVKDTNKDGHFTLFENPNLKVDFSLKEHQKEGVAWLQKLYSDKASGCLMADDMGLGKTLQILYFIDWHARKYPNHKPYLIVAPISLLENWGNEYQRFFKEPRLTVATLSSRDIPRKFDKAVIDRMQSCDIILTNYESLRISQLNFCAVEFDIIILDEAQKIKSPGTLVTNAAKALKGNFKIAMTGTPVENSLLDLWCIMDFCVPGLLGNAKSFASKYQTPLKSEDADLETMGNEIHDKLGIYFMRRLKSDVAKDLPSKFVEKKEVLMPQIQESFYQRVISEYKENVQPNMLLAIMRVREISEHPYLYDLSIADRSCGELVDTAARLQATLEFLDKIKLQDEKVIVFVERKEIQKMLQRVFLDRYGMVCKIINGDTPTSRLALGANRESRQMSIDNFQALPGFNIIIMSPIAAGMGLNVTSANHVIHYSRHWNPAKENQATDRAYRIGQTKDVYVYYPMAVSSQFKTFDQTLDDLLIRKTALATSTIFPTERAEVKLEDFEQLFSANQ